MFERRVVKSLCLALAVAILMTQASAAADAGWGVQFYYDAFDDLTFPLARISEQTERTSFDASSLLLACQAGSIAVIFQSGGISFDSAPETVKFRGPEGPQAFEFKALEIAPFGRFRAVVGEQAAQLLGIFEASSGLVPFQTEDKTGNFPTAGYGKVSAIMNSECITP